MKKTVLALALAGATLLPGMAFAGASTDAALGLGAFAVFNQILGGVGLFGHGPVVQAGVAAPPVAYVAPQPVFVAPPLVVYEPAVVYRPYPVYYRQPERVVVVERSHGWHLGQWKHGHGHDD